MKEPKWKKIKYDAVKIKPGKLRRGQRVYYEMLITAWSGRCAMQLQDLFSSEKNWTKHHWCCDRDGNRVDPVREANLAISWSLPGAVMFKCYPCPEFDQEQHVVIELIQREIGQPLTHDWNDAPERHFKEIQQLVRKLDI